MAEVFLHVGPHKTASTYIQKALVSNRKELRRYGVEYPEEYFSSYGHHELIKTIKKSPATLNLDKILRKSNKILFSSENFYNLTVQEFRLLKDVLRGHEVKVIYYYRHSTERLFSLWQETIKHGGIQRFEEFFYMHCLMPYQSHQLNQIIFLKKIEKIFGKTHLYLVDYHSASVQKNILGAFVWILGIRPKKKNLELEYTEKVNSMISMEKIEILRQLNALAMHDGIDSIEQKIAIRDVFLASYNEKNLLALIDSIERWISNHKKIVKLGDSYIDKILHKRVIRQYSERFVNEISEIQRKEYEVPNSFIIEDSKLRERIHSLYLEYIKTRIAKKESKKRKIVNLFKFTKELK